MFTGIVAELGEETRVEHQSGAARLTIRGSTEGVVPGEFGASWRAQQPGFVRPAS